MTTVQDFLDALAGTASIEVVPAEGEYLVTRYSGQQLDPPVRLIAPEHEFARYLTVAAPSSSGAFPEVDGQTAAFRLALVHLDEEIRRSDRSLREIRFNAGEMVVTSQPRDTAAPPARPGLAWQAEPPEGSTAS